MEKIEIPFGAHDSELKGWEYTIPDGMEAEIKDGKIIVKEKESEDEIIRNRLINLIRELASASVPIMTGGYFIDGQDKKYIAYLEKQKINTEGDFGRGYDRGYQAGYAVAKNEMRPKVATATLDSEKQKEPHYTKRNALFDKCVENCDPDVMKEMSDKVDEMLGKEQKPISSYDIVPYIDDKIAELQDMWREEKVAFDWDDMKDMIEDVARHFYHKEQNPAEWSEEDEDMLNSCISSIEEAKENRYAYKETDGDTSYDHEIAWLKSLRPSWKPNEWQMSMLLAVINDPNNAGSESCYLTLKSIYEQLKKLM